MHALQILSLALYTTLIHAAPTSDTTNDAVIFQDLVGSDTGAAESPQTADTEANVGYVETTPEETEVALRETPADYEDSGSSPDSGGTKDTPAVWAQASNPQSQNYDVMPGDGPVTTDSHGMD